MWVVHLSVEILNLPTDGALEALTILVVRNHEPHSGPHQDVEDVAFRPLASPGGNFPLTVFFLLRSAVHRGPKHVRRNEDREKKPACDSPSHQATNAPESEEVPEQNSSGDDHDSEKNLEHVLLPFFHETASLCVTLLATRSKETRELLA